MFKGLGWIVGSGTNINIWTEPWLSTESPVVPIGPPTAHNKDFRVSDLLKANSMEWNVEAIREHLPQYEVQIRTLTPSQFQMQDEIVWLPEKSGSYSTKSGYALCKLNDGPADLTFDWKKNVWNVNTSPKLRHFLWKIKNLALSLGENLLRRGMAVDGRCMRCGVLETERHIFMQCPFATRVWELIPASLKPTPNSISTPASLLLSCTRIINLPPTGLSSTALYPWVLWYLWSARNKLLFDNQVLNEQEVATLAVKEARIWQAAQGEKQQKLVPKNRTVAVEKAFSSETTHCFVDAAWNATTRGGGFGCIFRNYSNTVTLAQFSSNRCYVGSAFTAEAIAIKTALVEAVNLGLRTLAVWSDSQSLITAISSHERRIEAQGVMHDIFHLSTLFYAVSFHYVPRLSNMDADALAKGALLNFVNSV